MPSDPLEPYQKYLKKDPQDGDEYVLIDAKWFETWKNFLQSNESENQKVSPGPIDFTLITDPLTKDDKDEVQLRPDAVEGNDFTFIPLEMFKILENEYSIVGHPIIRKAIPRVSDGWEFVIETFYVPLQVCRSRSEIKEPKQIYLSRRTTIQQLKERVCDTLKKVPDLYHRLIVSTNNEGTNWEPVEEKRDLVLADVSILRNALITYESAAASATAASNQTIAVFQYPTNTYYTPGLCGLSNLGNTCFMNSALQCLSNVPELTRYFYEKIYEQDINTTNPLGMKGDIARAYGELIGNMWSGKNNYYAPKTLKQSVARYAPQFSGYNQQDSQEFMSFLLDGLHEDLNLVKKKPYSDKEDDDGVTNDVTLAEKQWNYYLARNQSRIQQIFHGQIKSVVTCLECGKTGRTFDPTCFLSLPLPEKKKIRKFKIEFVRLDGKVTTHHVKIHEQERIKNLVQAFCERFHKKTPSKKPEAVTPMEVDTENPDEEQAEEEEEEEPFAFEEGYNGPLPQYEFILAAEVYNHRIHTQYRDDTYLTSVLERDRIVFYQVPDSLKKDKCETILMPCVFRSADSYRANFGLPIYLTIPRTGCKGSHINQALEESINKYLPLSEVEQTDRPLYTPNLISNASYHQQTRALRSMLDETIDFNKTNTSLTVDVASSVVEKYEELERKRNPQEERVYSASNYNYNNSYNNEKEKKQATLGDCFKLFTKKETLSDDDRWFCPDCKKLQRATKKIDLWRLPNVLIIQLKRFNYTRYYRDKIDIVVDCPISDLDLSGYVIPEEEKLKAKYELIAISNHMGGLGGGHYTAYAKNDKDQQWHSFDDGYVGDANVNGVVSRAAYVLIYRRKQIENTRPTSAARIGSAKVTNNK